MLIFKTAKELQSYITELKKKRITIGFVPTMGALHYGHLKLIEQAQQQCNISVCSIFVNPTQFNNPADFEKYPRTIEKDIELLENQQLNILFLPTVAEIYPQGMQPTTPYNLGEVTHHLEGAFRPGHFEGVAQVVHTLLNIVQPHQLFMGQKDLQQVKVIQALIQKLNIDTQLIMCNTLRENSGLAMSSRNQRLNPQQLHESAIIYQALNYLVAAYQQNLPIPQSLKNATDMIQQTKQLEVEYLVIANANTLKPLQNWNEAPQIAACVAAYIGEVRLIDNVLIN